MKNASSGLPIVRVLHIINHFAHGGIESILLAILRNYDRGRFHHDVCCVGGEEGYLAGEARASGAEVLLCRKSVDLRGFSARFESLIAGRGYDIVHSHVNSWGGAVLRGASRAGVPVRIAHIHSAAPVLAGRGSVWNPAARFASKFVDRVGLRWISSHATHVLGVSGAALEMHWPQWRREPERFLLWTKGVDLARFKPRTDRAPARAPAMIFVGSFNTDKNQSELLDILALVRKRFPETVLRLIGEGARLETVRRRARSRGLADAVSFLGARSDVAELLADADIFISASRREGLGQAVLEAQAAGLPVVASDLDAHSEGVAPELRDFLYFLGRPDNAAEKIVRLLEDPALIRELGAAGRRFIVERFDEAANLALLQNWHADWAARAGRPVPGGAKA